MIAFAVPAIAEGREPLRSDSRRHLKGRTEALEDLAVELLARRVGARYRERLQGRERAAIAVEEDRF